MYSFDCVVNGVKYTVFFFSTFTGHFHPFTPYAPLDISEAYSRDEQTYYLAWYAGGEKTPRLHFLEKYWLIFIDVPVPKDRHSVPGRYYFNVKDSSTGYKIENEIDALSTTKLDVFYTYLVSNDGSVKESAIIKKSLLDKYSYTYNDRGALIDTKIQRSAIPEDEASED